MKNKMNNEEKIYILTNENKKGIFESIQKENK